MPAIRNSTRHRATASTSSGPTGARYGATQHQRSANVAPIEALVASTSRISISPPAIALDHAPTVKKSHGRRRAEGYIPRPRNCFIVFRSTFIAEHLGSGENQQNELSKAAARAWKTMTLDEKQPFIDIAGQEQAQHKLEHPDYQYTPAPRSSPSVADSNKASSKKARGTSPRARKSQSDSEDSWLAEPSMSPEPVLYSRAPRAAAVAAASRLEQIRNAPSPSPSSCPSDVDSASSDHHESASPGDSPVIVPTENTPSIELSIPMPIPPFNWEDIPASLKPGEIFDAFVYGEQANAHPLYSREPSPMCCYNDQEHTASSLNELNPPSSQGEGDEVDFSSWIHF